MTYQDLCDILKQQSPFEVVELLELSEDVHDLVDALGEYIEGNQEKITETLTEEGLL